MTDDGSVIAYDREAKPGVSNLLSIYSAMTGESIDEIVARYEGKMYGHLKVDLADIVVERLTPVRERTLELMDDPRRAGPPAGCGCIRCPRDRYGHH